MTNTTLTKSIIEELANKSSLMPSKASSLGANMVMSWNVLADEFWLTGEVLSNELYFALLSISSLKVAKSLLLAIFVKAVSDAMPSTVSIKWMTPLAQ